MIENGTSPNETAVIFSISLPGLIRKWHIYSLVSRMLEKAFQQLPEEANLLIHSDQGWYYQMKKYRHALKKRKITQSMSRKGNCYDNAVIESFFGTMNSEFLYLKDFESIEHFKQEFEKYIDYYNHKRIKAKRHESATISNSCPKGCLMKRPV